MLLSPEEQGRLRLDIFAAVEQLADARGGYLTWRDVQDFRIRGRNMKLVDPGGRGIRNPVEFDSTLAVVSSADGPYGDHVGTDGLLRYELRTGDPQKGDNRKLRVAMTSATPIILFERPTTGIYVPVVGASVVGEDPGSNAFIIAADAIAGRVFLSTAPTELEKKYVEQTVLRRVHQPVFRARVVVAYERACAVCHLRHVELLDAAHIIPDAHPDGTATVTNGLALCKIHHSAFDHNLLGITPDYKVRIRQDLLDETDGPMLRYGLQAMDGITINVPSRKVERPSKDGLARRYVEFIA